MNLILIIALSIQLNLMIMFFCDANCHSIDDAKRLLANKKDGYEKSFRPVINQSLPIEILISLELLSIHEFDEVKEQLTISAVLKIYWIDEFITWDPNDYGGLNQLVIESDNVWTPNLVLLNNVNKLVKIGDGWQLIRFLPNGFASFFPGDVFSASCRADITYYPLDRHKCSLTFTPWSLLENEITLIPFRNKVKTLVFAENGEWTLYNTTIERTPASTYVVCSLYLERKPLFILINVILPIIFMAFLNTVIFTIPVESGERISYSITVLLALAVFLTLVGDNLPKTSSPISLFGYYLLVVLIVSICITLATIYNVRVYFREDRDPIPDWLVRFVKYLQCKCSIKRNKQRLIQSKILLEMQDGHHGKQKYSGSQNKESDMSTDFYYNLYKKKIDHRATSGTVPYYIRLCPVTLDTCQTIKEEMGDATEMCSISWKDVSLAFDKLLFAFSFLVILTGTVVFFACISGSRKNSA